MKGILVTTLAKRICPALIEYFSGREDSHYLSVAMPDEEGIIHSFLVCEETAFSPIFVSREIYEQRPDAVPQNASEETVNQAQQTLWHWLNETGAIARGTSWEAEAESIIRDAVQIGYRAGLKAAVAKPAKKEGIEV